MAQRGRHLAPRLRRISRTWVIPLTLVMSLVLGGVAWADDISNSLDATVDAAAEVMNLTAGGANGTTQLFVVPEGDDGKNGCNLTGHTTLVVSVNSSNTSVATVSPSSITFASCGDTHAVTVTPVGGGSSTVSLTQTSNNTGGTFNLAPATFTVNVAAPTPSNTAPSAPGKPSATPASPNQGVFTLGWSASTDDGLPTGSSISYTLQHKDSDDAAFSSVATGLTTNSYSFTAASPEAEGTWTYHVVANDGSLSSTPSAASDAIKVDRSAPTAPTASFSPATANYNDGSINWWDEAVTVSYGDSTDPALADASAGSGVASYSAAQLFSSTGTHSYSGKATDNAGNQSIATSGTVGVDVTAPTISFDSCPTSAVLLNSSISLGWTASDGTGQSGLATAATDSVPLLTSSVGTKTATTPIARDNVGNESAAATCTYTVGYNFIGFDRPVDNNGVLNVVKAGQAVPLKFRLLDANNQPVLSGVTASVTVVSLSCDRATTSDLIEELATGSSGLQNLGDGYYQFNWATPKAYANSCKTMRLNLGEGVGGATALYHTADFEFRK